MTRFLPIWRFAFAICVFSIVCPSYGFDIWSQSKQQGLLMQEVQADRYLKDAKINNVVEQMGQQWNKLLHSEHLLEKLVEEKHRLKENVTWFMKPEQRKRVDEQNKKIMQEEFNMETIVADMNSEWQLLKPLYGLYSKLFLMEVFTPVIYALDNVLEIVTGVISWGFLLSLLTFGPIAGLFTFGWFALGFSLIPLLQMSSIVLLDIYYMFQLPYMMIAYEPSLVDFIIVYSGVMTIFFLITIGLFKLFYPDLTRKDKARVNCK